MLSEITNGMGGKRCGSVNSALLQWHTSKLLLY